MTKNEQNCQQKTGSLTSIKSETIVAITTRRVSIPTDAAVQTCNSQVPPPIKPFFFVAGGAAE
jgi:hypothetical protein